METTIHCNANEAKINIIRCIKAGLVPFIQSSPGIGKSSIVKQIANEFKLKLIDHRLSTSSPEDLLGLPHFENGKAVFSPFRDIFPLEDSLLPEDKDGWLIFFDEFNSAPRSVQAACYKIILDRQVGQYNLNKRCVIVCAGNKLDDNAITVNLSTAMQSRLVHIIMREDFNVWLENVAFKQNYDERVIGYLSMYPDQLMQFDPENTELTFPCPRTWEFVNRLIKNEPELNDSWLALLSGTVNSGVAMSFLTYCKLRHDMLSINEILKDVDSAPIPEKNETKWSTVFHLLSNLTEQNFDKIAKYIKRYPVDFKIIFYRAIKSKFPKLVNTPTFSSAMLDLACYFE